MTASAYRAGVVTALVAAFLTVWTTIVRDDGTGAAYFMVILAVGVGWFSASFRSEGMTRAMLGVAAMQACLGALVATAPVTATMPGGVPKALLFHMVFTALWLVSAAFFRVAAKADRTAAVAR
ncbi:MAG: hypothetical protein HOP96_04140 [Sphingomonas sp.]|nr:hypothetical protein [Sphingomonas sp.]